MMKRVALGLSFAAFIAAAPIAAEASRLGDCVRTVRSISDFTIQGDGWMWWAHAAGVYERDSRPATGSVLVFKRARHMSRGHVSLVSRVIDRRTIEVDHSWLDGRGLRRGMKVEDVSGNNDWSLVRVWHEPTAQYGQTVYPVYGFIRPNAPSGEERIVTAEARYSVAPAGRSRGRTTLPVTADVAGPAKLGKVHLVAAPGRKPGILNGLSVVRSHALEIASAPAARLVPASVTPARKPQPRAVIAAPRLLEAVAPMPARKPGVVVGQVASRED